MRKSIITILVALLLVSCDDFNRFNRLDLNLKVAARESILGVYGTIFDDVLILENDEYGRTMFAFRGSNILYEEDILAIVILQKTEENYSYIYDGSNFIQTIFLGNEDSDWNATYILSNFDSGKISALKDSNDWDKPLNEALMFKVPITTKKVQPLSAKQQRIIFAGISEYIQYRSSVVLSIDKNGLILCLMIGRKISKDSDDAMDEPTYLVMLDKEENVIPGTGIQQLDESLFDDYLEFLNAFKAENGWSFYQNLEGNND